MPYNISTSCIPSLSGINGTDCIGDTYQFLNTNFTNIANAVCNLSSIPITTSNTDTVQHVLAGRNLSSNVVSGSLSAIHLANNAVTTDKIALSAVTANKISLVTSLSSNGYQIMPGGLIMQWGTVLSPAGSVLVNTPFNFPITFPVSALSLVALGELATNDRVSYTNLTNTGATFQVADTNGATVQSATIKYIAIGY